ncbi:MAG: DUF4129 domain-containing protein [Streptosporangiaceae bacterium]
MTQSSAVWAAVSATAVLMLVFAVALGSSRSLAHVGGPGHLLQPQLIAGDLGVGFAVLALAVLAGLVYALWGGRRRKRRDDEPVWVFEQLPVPWWEKPLMLALALLPAAALLTAVVFVGHRDGRQPAPARSSTPGVTSSNPAAHPATAVPVPPAGPVLVHWWVWGVLAAVVAAAAVILAVRRRLRRAGDGRAQAVPRWLPAAIEESLAEIEREADPRRAVIRAYVGMERALARHGLGRRPFETPQEYLARALVAIRVSRPAGERLTRLFQRARFSEHPIEAQMKQDAIAALAAVRDELAGDRQ